MFDICLDDHYFSVCLAPSQLHVISHPCSTQPSISLAYSVLILLVTSCLTFAVLLSLLSHPHCFRCHHHFHITVATNTPLPSKYFSGAVELTTQLSKLINILWLPLCRINKLGYSYPRRLLRSPTLVGHQDCFLAPLPGIIALFTSLLGVILLAAIYPLWVIKETPRFRSYHPLQEKVLFLALVLHLIHLPL